MCTHFVLCSIIHLLLKKDRMGKYNHLKRKMKRKSEIKQMHCLQGDVIGLGARLSCVSMRPWIDQALVSWEGEGVGGYLVFRSELNVKEQGNHLRRQLERAISSPFHIHLSSPFSLPLLHLSFPLTFCSFAIQGWGRGLCHQRLMSPYIYATCPSNAWMSLPTDNSVNKVASIAGLCSTDPFLSCLCLRHWGSNRMARSFLEAIFRNQLIWIISHV